MPEDRRRTFLVLFLAGLASVGALAFMEKPAGPATSPAPADGEVAAAGSERRAPTLSPAAKRGAGAPPAASPTEPERLVEVRSETLVATVSSRTGALRDIRLRDDRFLDEEGNHRDMATAAKDSYPAFRLEVRGVDLPESTSWELTSLSPSAVRLEASAHGFRVVRKIEMGRGPYQIWSTVRVTNERAPKHAVRVVYATDHYVLREYEESGMFTPRSPEQSNAVCEAGEETLRIHRAGAAEPFAKHQFGPAVGFSAVETTYFASALVPVSARAELCRLSWFTSIDEVERPRFFGLLGSKREPEGTLYRAELHYGRKELAAGESLTVQTLGYFGPKDRKALLAAGHGLAKVIDLGWFSVVAEFLVALLAFIYGYVGNWGIAIIVMTVLFKLLFFPLTWKSFQSLAKMKVLKPEMDRLNELYGDDREKKGAAIMELYRKHGVNPLGGCLPQLLQMPVWIAFFASLSTNTELYRAGFALHWTDLSAPDSLFILPVVQGLLIYVQQKMTPTSMDPAQAKMMLYFMPAMMTVIYLFLPAGLSLYSVTNSVLTFAQQHLIFRQIERRAEAKAASMPPAAGAEPADESEGAAGDGGAESDLAVPRRTTRRRIKRG